MQQLDGSIRLSATDISNHLSCPHLTTLNREAAEGRLEVPWSNSPRIEVLRRRGFEHERRYVDWLSEQGQSVHVVTETAGAAEAFEDTQTAMRSGSGVIVQAGLLDGRWYGRADVLRRVALPSNLGNWSYEAVDTKLSRETKAGTILQLCAYSELLGNIQGRVPEQMHVVTPGAGFEPQSFRTAEFLAYYRKIRRRLEDTIEAEAREETYPQPVPHCDICRWWPVCDCRRREDDHLSLVAGISGLQRKEFAHRDIKTLAGVAHVPLPLPWKPGRGAPESYARIREQARIQWEGRQFGRPLHELLPPEPGRGLSRLPDPSPGDIFFDLEGDPFVEPRGLEYLWGCVTPDADEALYSCLWAFDREGEKAAYEQFVDFAVRRLEQHPGLHIYHYAPYEPAALKRLMGRYASREADIDRMLRAGVFVDLYGVVRQGLRASVEKYSIKDLEAFYGYERKIPLREASASLHAIEFGLEVGEIDSIEDGDREKVRLYNADDCHSTQRLRDWLEQLRRDCVTQGKKIDRPPRAPGNPPEKVDAREAKIRPLRERLLEGIPIDPRSRTPELQARWLLAHFLDWHRREEKAPWWEYFRLIELSDEELFEERSAVAQLEWQGRVGGTDRSPIHRYAFPHQETSVRDGDELQMYGGVRVGKVEAMDLRHRTLDIKHTGKAADLRPSAVFAHTIVPSGEVPEALFRIAQWTDVHAVDAPGAYKAGRDLLLRRPPRLKGGGVLPAAEEDIVGAARRLALQLDETVLAIQGPPGSGKTYTAARMALDLLNAGKKVGVTAGNHKVIRHLIEEIVKAGESTGFPIQAVHKVTDSLDNVDTRIRETKNNDDALAALQGGEVSLLGGTAWLWARDDFAESVDVLFVDEAGQLSLANALAASQGGKSLVLVGDPQQLEQPQQGSHPDGTEVSALEHVLAGGKTITPEMGLFLKETWRLAPEICVFTSEQAYENRLYPRAGLERQAIQGHPEIRGAGLWFAPVTHDGNRNTAPEETERVAAIVGSLQRGTVTWTDSDGRVKPLTLDDILIVAPYNAHVADLMEALPNGRIGTVDRFQGQEAPVVIYSLATSSADEAPRGMEFLYSLNRLNVATSRARCACILVASPRLFEAECRTPEQMRLANAFCRYLELARVLR